MGIFSAPANILSAERRSETGERVYEAESELTTVLIQTADSVVSMMVLLYCML